MAKLLADVNVTLPEPASATPVIAEGATVIVMLPLPVPSGPEQVTVYEVVAVNGPAVNVPVVPDPPPPVEEQEVLLVDDQVTVVLALYAIEVDAALRVTVGALAEPTVIVMLLVAVAPVGLVQVTV
ncbi:MAG: hypothetical protein KKH12_15390 [Gammaproteobacteria bacterium]|nr:hypothetical protein [Gammaproteobacteria bacterium]MBU1483047.1 hypothetical protein [Gammaproteobacteria bacterium]